jgi:hypothetical protein
VNNRRSRGGWLPWARRFLAGYACGCLVVAPSVSEGAELKKETLRTWDEYIQTSSVQMQDRLRTDRRFLWVDEVPQRSRQVRAGKILVSPVGQRVPKPVASGLIHDWIGAAFIPGATLDDVLGVVRDYDRYKMFYKPNVVDSKSLSTDGTADKFSMLLVNREIVATTALEGEYEACYLQFADKQWYSIAYTTRVQEIRDYGHRGEQMLPPDEGSGYIWRVYSLGRLEERDAGVYIEQEMIALSRDIPTALRWLAEPLIRHASKSALLISLQQTEEAVRSRAGIAGRSLPRHAATGATSRDAGSADSRNVARDLALREQGEHRR